MAGKTPVRPVRISDDLWARAQEVAREREESVSEVIRSGLERYVRRHSK